MSTTALGLIEFKTAPIGIYAADEMVKAAEVQLMLATQVCPGKYIAIVSGETADVSTAIRHGVEAGGPFLIDSYVIPNIAPAVFPALTGTVEPPPIESLGVIETIAAVAAVKAGDIVAKAAKVSLLEIRLARGLGGKGQVFFAGELGDVQAAERAAREEFRDQEGITSSVVISRPSKKLIDALV
jgi:microcompartment protein CcmL/EutN